MTKKFLDENKTTETAQADAKKKSHYILWEVKINTSLPKFSFAKGIDPLFFGGTKKISKLSSIES